jgi:hypothetical protein
MRSQEAWQAVAVRSQEAYQALAGVHKQEERESWLCLAPTLPLVLLIPAPGLVHG